MRKILIIDDDKAFLQLIEVYMRERYPGLKVTACVNPLKGLGLITPDLDLLLCDLEMPGLDGGKILAYATEKGLDKRKIIILSGRDADYLHERFPMGSCLAVLNKHEARQKTVLDMVFDSLQRKSGE